jgi:alkanesulfonate monooxygenase SsuD/methylene tetrahydromethanopterin reductase-like flavin-dependent oxidoreductase (luciferase family)
MPGRLPRPVEGFAEQLDPNAAAMLQRALACSVVGDPETIAQGIRAFTERTGADEIMATAMIYDHRARLRSFELTAEAVGLRR